MNVVSARDSYFELSESLLAVDLPTRWDHVRGVAARAKLAAPMFVREDAAILAQAAILHDIGYAPRVSQTGLHALDGAEYLSKIGVPERLCALVAHHSCAYREAELRDLAAPLARWVDEMTEVRDALWWADMTTTPTGEPTNVYDRIEEIQKRYGPEDIVTLFVRQAKSELVGAVERTEERLRLAGLSYTAK